MIPEGDELVELATDLIELVKTKGWVRYTEHIKERQQVILDAFIKYLTSGAENVSIKKSQEYAYIYKAIETNLQWIEEVIEAYRSQIGEGGNEDART